MPSFGATTHGTSSGQASGSPQDDHGTASTSSRSTSLPSAGNEKGERLSQALCSGTMVPVGHYVLPVGKGVAVMHSTALLHPCTYATHTNEQPCRVLSKRIPIKPAGTCRWDTDTSAGHCFLCHVYLRSGNEWIEHFGEQHSRGEKGSPDVDQLIIGGGPVSADVGGWPGSADVGGGPGSADEGEGPGSADIGGGPGSAQLGGGPGSAQLGGGPVPTICFRTKPNESIPVEQIVKIF